MKDAFLVVSLVWSGVIRLCSSNIWIKSNYIYCLFFIIFQLLMFNVTDIKLLKITYYLCKYFFSALICTCLSCLPISLSHSPPLSHSSVMVGRWGVTGELGVLRKSGRTLTLEMDHTSLNSAKGSKGCMYQKALWLTHKSHCRKEGLKQRCMRNGEGVITDIAEHRWWEQM